MVCSPKTIMDSISNMIQSIWIGGYNKESFIEAMNMSNIGTKPANYIIKRLISHQDKWISLINNSFLDDRTKKEYIELIDSRIGKLI